MLDLITPVQDLVRNHSPARVSIKADGSPVTSLDLALTELIETQLLNHLPDCSFYSEESEKNWNFPLIALDPLDGTREFVANRPEWALSVAYMPVPEFVGGGWIYNPQTNESYSDAEKKTFISKELFIGEVSRSEWEQGLFQETKSGKFIIHPMGSIAYKLGRLSAGKIDFVISLRPKNLWDIAAGTLLCNKAGLAFYSAGKRVTEVKKYYEPPLIWCSEQISGELLQLFPPMGKSD